MCIAEPLTVTLEPLTPLDVVFLKCYSLLCQLSVKRFVRKGVPSELRAQVIKQK